MPAQTDLLATALSPELEAIFTAGQRSGLEKARDICRRKAKAFAPVSGVKMTKEDAAVHRGIEQGCTACVREIETLLEAGQ